MRNTKPNSESGTGLAAPDAQFFSFLSRASLIIRHATRLFSILHMHSVRSLFIATAISATAFAQNGVIPPPPSVEPGGATPAEDVLSSELGVSTPNALSAEEKAAGWRLLFDGTRLIGMRGVQKTDPFSSGWKINAGELNLPKEIKDMDRMTGGDLITTEAYYDFEFRFEWKSSTSAESGIRYLVQEQIGKSPEGMEYQIIDDVHNSKGLKGGGIMRSGALEGVMAPGSNARLRTADPLEKRGDPWNEGRIVIQGNRVQHWMNGEKALEFDLGASIRTTATGAGLRFGPAWGTKKLTKIAILDQGTEVAFRNLKIRVISPTTAAIRPGQVPATPPTAAVPGTTVRPATPTVPVNPYLLPKRPLPPK
jgi:hypothetical protein